MATANFHLFSSSPSLLRSHRRVTLLATSNHFCSRPIRSSSSFIRTRLQRRSMASTTTRSVNTSSEPAPEDATNTRASPQDHESEQLEQQVKTKLDLGSTPTNEEARAVESHEHRTLGYRPEPGSVAAQAQSAAAKQTNREQIEQHVKSKLEAGVAPSQEEARLLESRAQRATGNPPEPGSIAAQAKSAADKHANLERMESQVKSKLDAGVAPSQDEARLAESREHRATGHYPEPGSTVANAQSAADKAANNQAGNKEQEFQQAVNTIAPKMAHEPDHITEEDARLLHSADRRAHGNVEKGGVTAQAQHLAAENKGAAKT